MDAMPPASRQQLALTVGAEARILALHRAEVDGRSSLREELADLLEALPDGGGAVARVRGCLDSLAVFAFDGSQVDLRNLVFGLPSAELRRALQRIHNVVEPPRPSASGSGGFCVMADAEDLVLDCDGLDDFWSKATLEGSPIRGVDASKAPPGAAALQRELRGRTRSRCYPVLLTSRGRLRAPPSRPSASRAKLAALTGDAPPEAAKALAVANSGAPAGQGGGGTSGGVAAMPKVARLMEYAWLFPDLGGRFVFIGDDSRGSGDLADAIELLSLQVPFVLGSRSESWASEVSPLLAFVAIRATCDSLGGCVKSESERRFVQMSTRRRFPQTHLQADLGPRHRFFYFESYAELAALLDEAGWISAAQRDAVLLDVKPSGKPPGNEVHRDVLEEVATPARAQPPTTSSTAFFHANEGRTPTSPTIPPLSLPIWPPSEVGDQPLARADSLPTSDTSGTGTVGELPTHEGGGALKVGGLPIRFGSRAASEAGEVPIRPGSRAASEAGEMSIRPGSRAMSEAGEPNPLGRRAMSEAGDLPDRAGSRAVSEAGELENRVGSVAVSEAGELPNRPGSRAASELGELPVRPGSRAASEAGEDRPTILSSLLLDAAAAVSRDSSAKSLSLPSSKGSGRAGGGLGSDFFKMSAIREALEAVESDLQLPPGSPIERAEMVQGSFLQMASDPGGSRRPSIATVAARANEVPSGSLAHGQLVLPPRPAQEEYDTLVLQVLRVSHRGRKLWSSVDFKRESLTKVVLRQVDGDVHEGEKFPPRRWFGNPEGVFHPLHNAADVLKSSGGAGVCRAVLEIVVASGEMVSCSVTLPPAAEAFREPRTVVVAAPLFGTALAAGAAASPAGEVTVSCRWERRSSTSAMPNLALGLESRPRPQRKLAPKAPPPAPAAASTLVQPPPGSPLKFEMPPSPPASPPPPPRPLTAFDRAQGAAAAVTARLFQSSALANPAAAALALEKAAAARRALAPQTPSPASTPRRGEEGELEEYTVPKFSYSPWRPASGPGSLAADRDDELSSADRGFGASNQRGLAEEGGTFRGASGAIPAGHHVRFRPPSSNGSVYEDSGMKSGDSSNDEDGQPQRYNSRKRQSARRSEDYRDDDQRVRSYGSRFGGPSDARAHAGGVGPPEDEGSSLRVDASAVKDVRSELSNIMLQGLVFCIDAVVSIAAFVGVTTAVEAQQLRGSPTHRAKPDWSHVTTALFGLPGQRTGCSASVARALESVCLPVPAFGQVCKTPSAYERAAQANALAAAWASTPLQLTTGYWNFRGLGAPVRMLCAYAQLNPPQHEDIKYEVWQKPRGGWIAPEWERRTKPDLRDRNAFAQLPYIVNHATDEVICGSLCCYMYLGRVLGLSGQTPIQQSNNEQALFYLQTLQKEFYDLCYPFNMNADINSFEASLQTHFSRSLPSHFEKLESWLESHSGGDEPSLAGDGFFPCVADLVAFEVLDQNEALAKAFEYPSPLQKLNLLKALHMRVRSLPRLRNYFSSYDASLPINNKMAFFK